MTTLRDAARQALAFTMRDFATMRDFQAARAVVQDILIAALAQRAEPTQTPCDIAEDGVCEVIDCCRNPPQQDEPVAPHAWMAVGGTIWRHKTSEDDVPLYTHPPRREWQGLKEWEINDGRDQLPTEDLCGWSFRQGVYFAEAKLKEKNHD